MPRKCITRNLTYIMASPKTKNRCFREVANRLIDMTINNYIMLEIARPLITELALMDISHKDIFIDDFFTNLQNKSNVDTIIDNIDTTNFNSEMERFKMIEEVLETSSFKSVIYQNIVDIYWDIKIENCFKKIFRPILKDIYEKFICQISEEVVDGLTNYLGPISHKDEEIENNVLMKISVINEEKIVNEIEVLSTAFFTSGYEYLSDNSCKKIMNCLIVDFMFAFSEYFLNIMITTLNEFGTIDLLYDVENVDDFSYVELNEINRPKKVKDKTSIFKQFGHDSDPVIQTYKLSLDTTRDKFSMDSQLGRKNTEEDIYDFIQDDDKLLNNESSHLSNKYFPLTMEVKTEDLNNTLSLGISESPIRESPVKKDNLLKGNTMTAASSNSKFKIIQNNVPIKNFYISEYKSLDQSPNFNFKLLNAFPENSLTTSMQMFEPKDYCSNDTMFQLESISNLETDRSSIDESLCIRKIVNLILNELESVIAAEINNGHNTGFNNNYAPAGINIKLKEDNYKIMKQSFYVIYTNEINYIIDYCIYHFQFEFMKFNIGHLSNISNVLIDLIALESTEIIGKNEQIYLIATQQSLFNFKNIKNQKEIFIQNCQNKIQLKIAGLLFNNGFRVLYERNHLNLINNEVYSEPSLNCIQKLIEIQLINSSICHYLKYIVKESCLLNDCILQIFSEITNGAYFVSIIFLLRKRVAISKKELKYCSLMISDNIESRESMVKTRKKHFRNKHKLGSNRLKFIYKHINDFNYIKSEKCRPIVHDSNNHKSDISSSCFQSNFNHQSLCQILKIVPEISTKQNEEKCISIFSQFDDFPDDEFLPENFSVLSSDDICRVYEKKSIKTKLVNVEQEPCKQKMAVVLLSNPNRSYEECMNKISRMVFNCSTKDQLATDYKWPSRSSYIPLSVLIYIILMIPVFIFLVLKFYSFLKFY